MRVLLRLAILFSVALADAQEHAAPKVRQIPSYLEGRERNAVELYEQVVPTVVTIFTSQQVFTKVGEEAQRGMGSGVLISSDGHVLTAAHVVDGSDVIVVKVHDGSMHEAELLFSEASADIALLLLKAPAPDLPHAALGDSDLLAVGQAVYVIGAPYGLENSYSLGNISGFREFNRLYDGTILAEFIQTDAAINSGNSGGPMFNSKGEVIGISSRILTESGGLQGLGFVVTINTAKQLLALEERAWTGLDSIFLDRDRLASFLNLDYEGGLLVQRVARGSPADKAGIRGGTIPAEIAGRELLLGGDLILEMGGQEACHAACLVQSASQIRQHDHIRVKLLRGGKLMEVVLDVSETRRNFLDAS